MANKQCVHIDITGNRYGKLVAVKRVENYKSPSGHTSERWLCRCDCGKEVVVIKSNLTRQKSCGCGKAIINGVCIPFILKEKANLNSKTGIRGVIYRRDRGKYRAEIGYKSKNRFLMYSEDINDCIAIRKEAENAVKNGTFEDFYYELKGIRID